MADDTRSQVQLRGMEENWNARFTSMNHKSTALSDSSSNSFNNKLDSKFTEVFEAINLLTNTVITSADRSPTTLQGEICQPMNFGGGWSRTPIAYLDPHRPPPQFNQQDILLRHGDRRQSANFVEGNRAPTADQNLHRSPLQFNQQDTRRRSSSSSDSWRLQLEESDRRFYQNLAESDRKFYRNLNDLKISFRMRSCEPVVNQEPEDFDDSIRKVEVQLQRIQEIKTVNEIPAIKDSFALTESYPVAATLVDQENIETSSSQEAKVTSKGLSDSGTDLEHFCRNFSLKIVENEEKLIVIPEFDGKTEFAMGILQSKGANNNISEIDGCELYLLIDKGDGISQLKLGTWNSIFGAHKVFEQMPKPSSECVLIAEAVDVTVMEGSHTQESFDQLVTVVSLSFDPGGEEHDKIYEEFMHWSEHLGNFKTVHKGTVRSNVCNVFDEMLDPANKALTEVADLLLQSESYTPVVFDPGGSFLLLKCHTIQRKIWNWNSQCKGIQEEFVCWVKESESADCRKFTLLQWDPGGFILVKLGEFLLQLHVDNWIQGSVDQGVLKDYCKGLPFSCYSIMMPTILIQSCCCINTLGAQS